MKKGFLLGFFAVMTGCLASAPVVIRREERALPAKNTVARLIIAHDVVSELPEAQVSIRFNKKDVLELGHYNYSHCRADVFTSPSRALQDLAEIITKKVETRTSFSLCFDFGSPEKNVVARCAFLKNGVVRVTFLTLLLLVPVCVVNVFKAILLDETLLQKHWGKGLVAVSVILVGSQFLPQASSGPGTILPKQPQRREADPALAGNKTLEHYFSDYANKTTMFPYGDTIRSLEYILGRRDYATGAMHCAMDWPEAECGHNWIQWAFPTATQSGFNSEVLLSSAPFQQRMQDDPALRVVLLECFRYYLNFMGLDLAAGCDLEIKKDAILFVKIGRFDEGIQNFLGKSHNWLRISRILESLRIHGLEGYAHAFYEFLTESTGIESLKKGFSAATASSHSFWKSSAGC